MDLDNQYGCLVIQQSLLALIKQFHSLCFQNNVNYSLIGGSLLGAVRENGFIPWDDDMDVMIDRDNLKKVIDLLSTHESLMINRTLWVYKVQRRADIDKVGYHPTLDLFPVDNMPNGKYVRKWHLLKLKCAQGMIKGRPDYNRFSFVNKVYSFVSFYLGRPFSLSTKLNRYDKLAQKYNHQEAKNKAIFFSPFHQLGFLYPPTMMNHLMLHQFEDTKVFITKDYDEVLTLTYGDYMTPPAINDRKPLHH